MSNAQDLNIFDELPEPGVFSGVMTLLGGLLGAFLVVYSFLYGPLAEIHLAVVIGCGLLFTFAVASFMFLIGWMVEVVWPLLLLLVFIGVLLVVPLVWYFGGDVLMKGVSQALMFG